MLIHIQDAHGVSEAQKSIESLLDYLQSHYGLNRIYLEGAVGGLDTERFNFFDSPVQNEKIWQKLFSESVLSGSELYLLKHHRGSDAQGVEEEGPYAENLRLFKAVMGEARSSESLTQTLYDRLDLAATRILSPASREMLKAWWHYEDKREGLLDFLKALLKNSGAYKTFEANPWKYQARWPNLSRLVALKNLENRLDPKKINREKETFLNLLRTRKVNPSLIGELEKRAGKEGRSQEGRSTRSLFEKIVEALGNQKETPFAAFPHFIRWGQYQILSEEIRAVALAEETEQFVHELAAGQLENAEQKNILKLFDRLLLLKKALKLELSRKDWKALLNRKEKVRPVNIAGNFNQLLAGKPGIAPLNPEDFKKGDGAFGNAVEFYKTAVRRDSILINYTLEDMEKSRAAKAVLITGGFHGEGIKELLNQKGIAYIQISPAMHGEISSHAYVDRMMHGVVSPAETGLSNVAIPAAVQKETVLRRLGEWDYIAGRVEEAVQAAPRLPLGAAWSSAAGQPPRQSRGAGYSSGHPPPVQPALVQAASLGESIDFLFDPRVSDSQVLDFLKQVDFGQPFDAGSKQLVIPDKERRFVLKAMKLISSDIQDNDLEYILSHRLTRFLYNWIRALLTGYLGFWLKEQIKSRLVKWRWLSPRYEPKMENGYEVVERRYPEHLIRFRQISLPDTFDLKGFPLKVRLLAQKNTAWIIQDYVPEEWFLGQRVKQSVEAGDLTTAESMIRGAIGHNVSLWGKGVVDTDAGINIPENFILTDQGRYENIDWGAVKKDEQEICSFLENKQQQMAQIDTELARYPSQRQVVEAFGQGVRPNNLAHVAMRFYALLPEPAADRLAQVFLDEVRDKFTVANWERIKARSAGASLGQEIPTYHLKFQDAGIQFENGLNSVTTLKPGENLTVRIRIPVGLRDKIQTPKVVTDLPGQNEKAFSPEAQNVEGFDIWAVNLEASQTGGYYYRPYVEIVSDQKIERFWASDQWNTPSIRILPQWATDGMNTAIIFVKTLRRPGTNQTRFGTFTDLKWYLKDLKFNDDPAKRIQLDAVLLLPFTDSFNDSPYEAISPYATHPKHVDWDEVNYPGAQTQDGQPLKTKEEKFKWFKEHVASEDAEFQAFLNSGLFEKIWEYADVKAIFALRGPQDGPAQDAVMRAKPEYHDLVGSKENRQDFGCFIYEQYIAHKQVKEAVKYIYEELGIRLGFDIPFFPSDRGALAFHHPADFVWEEFTGAYGLKGSRIKAPRYEKGRPEHYQTWRGQGEWNYDELRKVAYEPVLAPFRFWRDIGFRLARWDAAHMGPHDLHQAMNDQVLKGQNFLLIPEQLGGVGEGRDNDYESLLKNGGLLYHNPEYAAEKGYQEIVANMLWHRNDYYFAVTSTHDSPRMPWIYRNIVGPSASVEEERLKMMAIHRELALSQDGYTIVQGDERGHGGTQKDDMRINVPITTEEIAQGRKEWHWDGVSPMDSAAERYDLRSHIANLIRIRKQHPVFSQPSTLEYLWNTQWTRVSSFLRASGDEAILVVNNLTGESQQGKVLLKGLLPRGQPFILTNLETGDDVEFWPTDGDVLHFQLKPGQAYVFDLKKIRARPLEDFLHSIFEPDDLNALKYFAEPRHAENSNVIAQFLARFIGPWNTSSELEEFKRRLGLLIEKVALPRGAFVYLVGAPPANSQIGIAVNDPEFAAKALRDHDIYEAVVPGKGRVIIQKTDGLSPEPGKTASVFAITDLWGNREQVQAVAAFLHEKGYRFILDITGHVAVDAPVVLEHPEWCRYDFDSKAYWDGLPSEQSDEQIMAFARVEGKPCGFLIYLDDPDGALRERFGKIPDFPWGAVRDNPHQVRVLLRHHRGLGPMNDTVSLNLDHPEARAFYILGLQARVANQGVDGFRVDLSERISRDALDAIKAALARLPQNPVVIHEDYEDDYGQHLKFQATAESLHKNGIPPQQKLPYAYYDHQLYHKLFGLNPGDIQAHLRWLAASSVTQREVNVHYTGNADERLPLLNTGGNREVALALETIVQTLPGLRMFYIYQALGWQWGDDIKRELNYDRFLELARQESQWANGSAGEELFEGLRGHTGMMSQFRHLLRAADYPVFQDSRGFVAFQNAGPFVAYGRPLAVSEGGAPETGIVVVNLSGQVQSGTIEMNDEERDKLFLKGGSEESYFFFYDLLGEHLYLYTRDEINRLPQTLSPWERRMYLVREVSHPGVSLKSFKQSLGTEGMALFRTRQTEQPVQALSLGTPENYFLEKVLKTNLSGLRFDANAFSDHAFPITAANRPALENVFRDKNLVDRETAYRVFFHGNKPFALALDGARLYAPLVPTENGYFANSHLDPQYEFKVAVSGYNQVRHVYNNGRGMKQKQVVFSRNGKVLVNELVTAFPGVYHPWHDDSSQAMIEAMTDEVKPGMRVYIGGLGSGFDARYAARLGAFVQGVDVNEGAIPNVFYNFETDPESSLLLPRLLKASHNHLFADLTEGKDKFDLIFFNLPSNNTRPEVTYDYSFRDPGRNILDSLLVDAVEYLSPNGKLVFVHGEPEAVRHEAERIRIRTQESRASNGYAIFKIPVEAYSAASLGAEDEVKDAVARLNELPITGKDERRYVLKIRWLNHAHFEITAHFIQQGHVSTQPVSRAEFIVYMDSGDGVNLRSAFKTDDLAHRKNGLPSTMLEALAESLPLEATLYSDIYEPVTLLQLNRLLPPEYQAAVADILDHYRSKLDNRERITYQELTYDERTGLIEAIYDAYEQGFRFTPEQIESTVMGRIRSHFGHRHDIAFDWDDEGERSLRIWTHKETKREKVSLPAKKITTGDDTHSHGVPVQGLSLGTEQKPAVSTRGTGSAGERVETDGASLGQLQIPYQDAFARARDFVAAGKLQEAAGVYRNILDQGWHFESTYEQLFTFRSVILRSVASTLPEAMLGTLMYPDVLSVFLGARPAYLRYSGDPDTVPLANLLAGRTEFLGFSLMMLENGIISFGPFTKRMREEGEYLVRKNVLSGDEARILGALRFDMNFLNVLADVMGRYEELDLRRVRWHGFLMGYSQEDIEANVRFRVTQSLTGITQLQSRYGFRINSTGESASRQLLDFWDSSLDFGYGLFAVPEGGGLFALDADFEQAMTHDALAAYRQYAGASLGRLGDKVMTDIGLGDLSEAGRFVLKENLYRAYQKGFALSSEAISKTLIGTVMSHFGHDQRLEPALSEEEWETYVIKYVIVKDKVFAKSLGSEQGDPLSLAEVVDKELARIDGKVIIACVCGRNTLRSPTVEILLEKMLREKNMADPFAVMSAGLNQTRVNYMPHPVYEAALLFGVPKKLMGEILNRFWGKPLDRKFVEAAHLILVVEEDMRRKILEKFSDVPGIKNKIIAFSELKESEGDLPDAIDFALVNRILRANYSALLAKAAFNAYANSLGGKQPEAKSPADMFFELPPFLQKMLPKLNGGVSVQSEVLTVIYVAGGFVRPYAEPFATLFVRSLEPVLILLEGRSSIPVAVDPAIAAANKDISWILNRPNFLQRGVKPVSSPQSARNVVLLLDMEVLSRSTPEQIKHLTDSLKQGDLVLAFWNGEGKGAGNRQKPKALSDLIKQLSPKGIRVTDILSERPTPEEIKRGIPSRLDQGILISNVKSTYGDLQVSIETDRFRFDMEKLLQAGMDSNQAVALLRQIAEVSDKNKRFELYTEVLGAASFDASSNSWLVGFNLIDFIKRISAEDAATKTLSQAA